MGVKIFQITLQNAEGLYKPGDWVNGQVVLELDKPTKARGVKLRFEGAAKVHWSETRTTGTGDNRQSETVHYSSSRNYFQHEVLLWAPGGGGEGDRIPPGHNTYPFQFLLPMNLPASFKGARGSVSYQIDCKVDIAWKFDYKCQMPFTVFNAYDLNQLPRTREPAHSQGMKTLGCLCCTSGPITNRLKMDRTGYVPGETIVVTAEVDNQSRRKMKSFRLELVMRTTYRAVGNTCTLSETIASFCHGAVRAGDTAQWRQNIPVPPLVPSDLIHCDIIDVNYFIVLTTIPSGIGSKLSSSVCVTIGSVPLTNTQHRPKNAPSTAVAMTNSMIPLQPIQRPQDAAAAPPAYSATDAGRPTLGQVAEFSKTQISRDSAPYPTSNALPYPTPAEAQAPPSSAPYPIASAAPPYPRPGCAQELSSNAQYPNSSALPYPSSPRAHEPSDYRPFSTGPAALPYPVSPAAASNFYPQKLDINYCRVHHKHSACATGH